MARVEKRFELADTVPGLAIKLLQHNDFHKNDVLRKALLNAYDVLNDEILATIKFYSEKYNLIALLQRLENWPV